MEAAIVSSLPQLGVAGASILVMYLMYKDASARSTAKDDILIKQVEKHEATLKGNQEYMKEVHASTMTQLAHASRVIEDNVKAYERVISYIDRQK